MSRLFYVPIVLSLVVLGAHFLRDANHLGVAVSVGLIGLLFVKRPIAARAVQVALLLGALEWVWTITGPFRASSRSSRRTAVTAVSADGGDLAVAINENDAIERGGGNFSGRIGGSRDRSRRFRCVGWPRLDPGNR